MYKGRRILAVVPARGGSKGIPLKNLRRVGGRTLVGLVGTVVQQVTCIDRAIVSTDHNDIAEEAEANGISAPFRRPAELSGDRVGDVEVLQDALRKIEEIDNLVYEIVVMLQPTSPLRKAKHIKEAIRLLVDRGDDAVWSVTETDLKAHPLKQLVVDSEGRLGYYDPKGSQIIARQQLSPVYHRNGVVYAVTRNCLLEKGTLLAEKASALVIKEPVVNVDTEEDLIVAGRHLGHP